ncbi:DegT/DnrJ/EryC1/StrS family aminotransferase [Thiotrichales bacterium HSG1]|nr:DegT/DnrJ/EryC1/StrS family aminotransferase [Thiotrichales bacterium HSG1]
MSCGEGGALLINDEKFMDRAETLLEKGTNRKQFIKGLVDKYTWVDIGSSYLLSELNAAYLYGQLENEKLILNKRLDIFNKYYKAFWPLQSKIQLPVVPKNCELNGHIFYLICRSNEERKRLISFLQEKNIQAVFHYIPLHQSPMGKKWGDSISLPITEDMSARLVRLPIFYSLTDKEQNLIINEVISFYT